MKAQTETSADSEPLMYRGELVTMSDLGVNQGWFA